MALLSLSQRAEAKVVYTATNDDLLLQSPATIDFDHDGAIDLYVGIGASGEMYAFAPAGNAVRTPASGSHKAAAMFFGSPIGAGGNFGDGGEYDLNGCTTVSDVTQCHGPWYNVPVRYLGVKFQIAGQTHYGWVRIKLTTPLVGSVIGYAYESTPNTPIGAGYLDSSALGVRADLSVVDTHSRFAGLGLLALGSVGMPAWRREE